MVEAAGVEPASESSGTWLLHAYLSFLISPAFCPESGERARASLWGFRALRPGGPRHLSSTYRRLFRRLEQPDGEALTGF